MVRYAQLVIGPAGSGKSTYCSTIQKHCASVGRSAHVVNLDPAAENFDYNVALDVRELVSLDDVMDELKLGPNGGLLYCMEYLEENMDEWLKDELDEYTDDDYLLFDCPGQIELYTHVPVLRSIADALARWDFRLCVVYVMDSQFVTDLELPHVSVLSKMDRVEFYKPDMRLLLEDLHASTGPRFERLNYSVATLLDDYSMVSFLPLDITSEDSIAYVLANVDNTIQFGEDGDVNVGRLDRTLDADVVGGGGEFGDDNA
eukprot:jgi/Chlat1/2376/Chrsp17S02816